LGWGWGGGGEEKWGRVYTDRDDDEGKGAGAREGISIIAIDEGLGQGTGLPEGEESPRRCVGSARCSDRGGVADAAAVVVALYFLPGLLCSGLSAARFALGGF